MRMPSTHPPTHPCKAVRQRQGLPRRLPPRAATISPTPTPAGSRTLPSPHPDAECGRRGPLLLLLDAALAAGLLPALQQAVACILSREAAALATSPVGYLCGSPELLVLLHSHGPALLAAGDPRQAAGLMLALAAGAASLQQGLGLADGSSRTQQHLEAARAVRRLQLLQWLDTQADVMWRVVDGAQRRQPPEELRQQCKAQPWQQTAAYALAAWLPRLADISNALLVRSHHNRHEVTNGTFWVALARCTRAVAEQAMAAREQLMQEQAPSLVGAGDGSGAAAAAAAGSKEGAPGAPAGHSSTTATTLTPGDEAAAYTSWRHLLLSELRAQRLLTSMLVQGAKGRLPPDAADAAVDALAALCGALPCTDLAGELAAGGPILPGFDLIKYPLVVAHTILTEAYDGAEQEAAALAAAGAAGQAVQEGPWRFAGGRPQRAWAVSPAALRARDLLSVTSGFRPVRPLHPPRLQGTGVALPLPPEVAGLAEACAHLRCPFPPPVSPAAAAATSSAVVAPGGDGGHPAEPREQQGQPPQGQPSRAMQACDACRKVQYCCKECQRDDWKYRHKAKCGAGGLVVAL